MVTRSEADDASDGKEVGKGARVRRALAAAQARGARLGRPRVLTVQVIQDARTLRASGTSWASIARRLGISRTSARRACTSPPSPRRPRAQGVADRQDGARADLREGAGVDDRLDGGRTA